MARRLLMALCLLGIVYGTVVYLQTHAIESIDWLPNHEPSHYPDRVLQR